MSKLVYRLPRLSTDTKMGIDGGAVGSVQVDQAQRVIIRHQDVLLCLGRRHHVRLTQQYCADAAGP